MRPKGWLIAAFVIFATAGCVMAPVKPKEIPRGDYTYVQQYLSWLIRKEMKKHDVAGLSIAIVDDQKVVWAEGFGFADVENRIPATAETVYRVASVSKLFTATAVMQLTEEGLIDIDRPIQTYLPEFSMKTRFPDAGPITLRSILTHHSGLPYDRLKGRFVRNPAPFTQLVNEIREDYVAYPPNLLFNYSNLGYALLGQIVERASGQEFAAYLEDKVLGPMGMARSSFVLRPDVRPLLAKGYMDGHAIEVEEFPLRNLPASALYSNVLDLSRFMQMVFADGRSDSRQILKPETLVQMLRPQNTDVPLDFDLRIGLGWFLQDSGIPNAGLAAGHEGGMMIFFSDLLILPEQKLGVVVLGNTNSSSHVVFQISNTALRLALEAKTGLRPPEPAERSEPQPGSLSLEELKPFEGRYLTMIGPVRIVSKSDRLQADTPKGTAYLMPHSDGWFSVEYRLSGFIPRRPDRLLVSFATVSDREVVLVKHENQKYLFGEKIRRAPISNRWMARVGDYEVLNQDDYLLVKRVRVRNEDGLLLIEARAEPPGIPGSGEDIRMTISPISDTEAVIMAPGFGMGETIRIINQDGEERLHYSGYELRQISRQAIR